MKKREDYGKDPDSWFSSQESSLISVASQLRVLIKNAIPDINETIKWGMPTYEKNALICALRSANGYIALQFYMGSNLDDPDSILEGSGKNMRHVKVYKETDIQKDLFMSWIRTSATT